MLSKKEVEKVAKLARLGLTPKEIEKYRKELSVILDYFEKLKEADVSGISPTSHSTEMENVTRSDEVKRAEPEVIKKLIELAPETKEGFLKVKSIFRE